MIKKRNFIVLVAFLCSCLVTPSTVLAADFNYKIKTQYTIGEDKKTTARTIIEVDNATQATVAETLSIPVAGDNITVNEAVFDDESQTEATYNEESKSIIIDTKNAPTSQTWSVTLRYDVSIMKELGKTVIFQVAPQNYGNMHISSQVTTIATSLELGLGKPRGPEPTTTNTAAEQQILTWATDEGPQTKAVGVSYGEVGVAAIEFSSELKNDGWWWKTVAFTLPPDTNQQQVFLENISPQPSSITLDTDGNVVAKYSLRPKQSIKVQAKALVAVSNYSYSLSDTATKNEIPTELTEQYTNLNDVWKKPDIEFDIDSNASVTDSIKTIYTKVSEDIEDASVTFETAKINADMLVGALRSNNIPARTVIGKVFSDGGSLFEQAQSHAWVEVYTPNLGWMTLDPTFEQKGEYFGVTDVLRVGLVLRGISPDYPPASLDAASIEYLDDQDIPEIPDMKPELTSVNYMILPGLALSQTITTMPKGIIVDGTALAHEDSGVQKLGSLAPLQIVKTRSLRIGGSAFSASGVTYGMVDGSSENEISTVLAETTTSVSYIPMICLFAAIFIIVIFTIIRRKRGGKSKTPKNSNEDGEIIENPAEENILGPDDSIDNLIMTFDDEEEDMLEPPKPGMPPYIHLSGKPQKSTQMSSPVTKLEKDDILPPTGQTGKKIPVKTAMPKTQRRRKPPRLIQ